MLYAPLTDPLRNGKGGPFENRLRMCELAVKGLTGVSGPEVTPRLLARVAELSGGRSLDLNVDLVVNNARIAARVAAAFAALG